MKRTLSTRIGAALCTALTSGAILLHGGAAQAYTGPVSPARNPHAPTVVQAVSLAGDSPAQMWYFPKNPATVVAEVYQWLRHATPTAIHMPSQHGIFLEDYMGPAQLSFTNQSGRVITVYPAFYLAESNHRVAAHYFPNVVACQTGKRITYLTSPALYRYLHLDALWEAQFAMEVDTPAQERAIHAVFSSPLRKDFRGFPTRPAVAARNVRQKNGTVIRATCTTQAVAQGKDMTVILRETWNNGNAEHTWRMVVSPAGAILSHVSSGTNL